MRMTDSGRLEWRWLSRGVGERCGLVRHHLAECRQWAPTMFLYVTGTSSLTALLPTVPKLRSVRPLSHSNLAYDIPVCSPSSGNQTTSSSVVRV